MIPPSLLIGLAVAVALLGLPVLYLALSANRQQERKRRILATIQGQISSGIKGDGGARDKRRATLARKLKEAETKKTSNKKNTIEMLIMQAGLEISVTQFWLISVFSGLVFTIICVLLKAHPLVTLLMLVTGLLGFPRFVIKKITHGRQKKFLSDFADALEAMIRLLKAGMPIAESVSMVAREFTGPMGQIMGRIYDQQKLGTPLGEAVINGAERMPIPEMQMFATAISIQQQTGSSLSEVLGNLSRVIRARFRLKRKVQALSAEAKASAAIIGALPFLVSGGLYAINPKYMEILFTEPTGKMLLTGALVWMGMGILVMKQMINFRV